MALPHLSDGSGFKNCVDLRAERKGGEKHSWMSVSVQCRVAECSEG